MACLVAGVDNEQALAAFERAPTATSSERLRAARFLAQNATGGDRNRLSKIRGVERNSWVRRALDQALKRSEMGRSDDSTEPVEEIRETPFPDARLYDELRAQAIAETSAMFLHELRPLVGFLDADAATEIDRYECSRTKVSVNRVRSLLNAIARLRMASVAPDLQEFDLTDLVVRVAVDEVMRGRATLDNFNEQVDEATDLDDEAEQAPQQPVVKLSLGRRSPVATTGDAALVEMVAANALRNAVEAVLAVWEPHRNGVTLNWGVTATTGDAALVEMVAANALRNAVEAVLAVWEPHRNGVTLNWGVTDIDSWIVVHDEGCGLSTVGSWFTMKDADYRRGGIVSRSLALVLRRVKATLGWG